MKILITGAAGFVGSNIARYIKAYHSDVSLMGIDNLSRRGSEYNLSLLKSIDCKFFHGDIRSKEDIDDLPKADWIIDCAANPSVLAGLDGGSLGLINNNLTGTINLLEKCRKDHTGFIMLSTSRVYSINDLINVPLTETGDRFEVKENAAYPVGFSRLGVAEQFSTTAPVSLYGSSKLASEILALEYHYTFGFPVWINRCGVIAGPGQFGKIDQGIFSFWIYNWINNKPLSYIGFNGTGHQVRDFFSPDDLSRLILTQVNDPERKVPPVVNAGGGLNASMSLKELNNYCTQHFNFKKDITVNTAPRTFDIPYYVTDNTAVEKNWGWKPEQTKEQILDGILAWGLENKSLIESGF
jgi:CDP-paratose 2-epimerase